jgi:hypothetical protein
MSELLGLGGADGDVRWLGIRRHQATLVIGGIGLVGDWVVRTRSGPLEVFAGIALLTGALPFYDSLTIGESLLVGLRYLSRSRWTRVAVVGDRTALSLRARGQVMVQGFALQHRGRLDLSGHDLQRAQDLAAFADALATGDRSAHVSVHVRSKHERAHTLLSLEKGTIPPEGWSESSELLLVVMGLTLARGSTWLLERWGYLRSGDGLVRVLRIRDFSAVPDGRALLERLQQSGNQVTVALHFDVVSGRRAQRIAERAVHRLGSDGAASRSVGFRRTARADRSLERLAQREMLVASGRALLRVAVYVSVHATSRNQLHQRVSEVLRRAHEAGLRCERGLGRQSIWYCQQLPGGPGW